MAITLLVCVNVYINKFTSIFKYVLGSSCHHDLFVRYPLNRCCGFVDLDLSEQYMSFIHLDGFIDIHVNI